jgi:hypothetical protein
MIDWLTNLLVAISFLAAAALFVMSVARRKPSLVSLSVLGAVELGLLVQTVASIMLVSVGDRAKTDTVEFFGYLFVATMIPIGAGFWALVERTRWSTMVLAVAAGTVGVMVTRMQQIWFGF